MPILTYAKRDEVPADLLSDVKEVDGKFQVNVVLKTALDDFRERNIAVSKERDTLKTEVEGLKATIGSDPEALKAELVELRATAQSVKDGKLKTNEDVDKAIAARITETRTKWEQEQLIPLQRRAEAAEKKSGESESKFKRSMIDREVTNAVLAQDSGINPTALPDILHRAHTKFSIAENDRVVAKNGDAVEYGSDGVTPLSPKEWLTQVLKDAPYLGLPSAGGGASGGADSKGLKGVSEKDLAGMSGAEMLRRARAAK